MQHKRARAGRIRCSGNAVWMALGCALAVDGGISVCRASYHFMQIEKAVGAVNGDVTAQAIQLRMRVNAQERVNRAQLIAWDANGENPIVLIDFESPVTNAKLGATILIASEAMAAYTRPPVEPDFTFTSLIPESYFAAGSITFENDETTLIVWRLSWGGSAYTGLTLGALTNDDDRDFGPPFDGPLPGSGLEVLEFQGGPSDKSTSNLADYALSDGAGVLTNNAGQFFTLIVPNCEDPDGVGPDSDGDHVRDACDACPQDPLKLEPGSCGCGVPDTDMNLNGIPDCREDGEDPDNSNDNTDGSDDPGDPDSNANDNADDGGEGAPPGRTGCTPGLGMLAILALFLGRPFGLRPSADH